MTGRRVVLHEDDVGMCKGANDAFFELSEFGVLSSGAVMVPCPWFLEVAEAVGDDPRYDLGVHLTLNAEKRHYKWRPLTAPPPSAGLTDANGFFWPDVVATRRAAPEAVEAELRAQVEAALAAGIDVTHLDAHMGAAMAPEFCGIYLRLGLDYRLPILLPARLDAYTPNDLHEVTEADFGVGVKRACAAGFAIFDAMLQTVWDRPRKDPAEPAYRALIEGIGPGLTFLCLHCNAPGDVELIEPDSAYLRTDEYALLRSSGFRDWLAGQDLEIIGMRPLREELRARLGGKGAA